MKILGLKDKIFGNKLCSNSAEVVNRTHILLYSSLDILLITQFIEISALRRLIMSNHKLS